MSDRLTTEWCRDSFTMLKHSPPGRTCERVKSEEAPKVIYYPIDAYSVNRFRGSFIRDYFVRACASKFTFHAFPIDVI